MFNKKIMVSLLIGGLLFTGCSKKENTLFTITDDQPITLESIDKKDITELMSDSESYTYLDDIDFQGCFNDDQAYYGYAIDKVTSIQSVMYLDFSTGNYEMIYKASDANATISLLGLKNNNFVYQIFNDGNLTIRLYNTKTKEDKEIINSEGSSMNIDSTVDILENELYFSMYDKETDHYIIYHYDIKDDLLEKMISKENRNCANPVVIDKSLYYLSVNNSELSVEFVEYNMESKQEKVLYETKQTEENKGLYINALYKQGNQIYLQTLSSEKAIMYEVDLQNKQLKPIIESDSFDMFRMNDQYMTWGAASTSPNRVRRQYYLYDYKNNINYANPDGYISLGNQKIVRIKYLKEDEAIPKGEVNSNENTIIQVE